MRKRYESLRYWLTCFVIAAAALAFDLSQPLGVAAGVPYVLLVLMGLFTTQLRVVFALSAVAAALNLIGYNFSGSGATSEVVLLNRATAFLIIVAVATSVSVVVRQRNDSELQAQIDPLTHCYNRKYLDTLLNDEIVAWKTHHRPLSVIMIDIDHFKAVNDDHGHQAGDQVLCSVAKTCVANLRGADKICRYGGEEFAAVLPDADDRVAALVAERIRHAVDKMRFVRATDTQVTVSLGVAEMCSDYDSAEALLHAADLAMYQAKQHGRNQVRIGMSGRLIDFPAKAGKNG